MSSGVLAPSAVEAMFDRISPVYDPMNRLMTAGLDRRWRRLAVSRVVQPGDRVLDACCGTGDLAVAAEEADRLLAIQPLGVPLTRIGQFIAEPGLWSHSPDGSRVPLVPRGYEHRSEP